jgi:CubicO group peptidase (beta-lactamase class C family)
VVTAPLPGVSLLVAIDGEIVFREAFGTFTVRTQVPIASGTKWFSGTTIMTLVDDGTLSLDDALASYVPSFDHPGHDAITVRQAMSHTSGLPGRHPIVFASGVTLQEAGAVIGGLPLEFEPGTMFGYGGVSMQATGAAAEVAAGMPWVDLFDARVASPLGLRSTNWLVAGGPVNPGIGGGLRSTLDDAYALLAMIESGGVASDGTRVLSPAAVEAMLVDQAGSPPIHFSPLDGVSSYGIGVWREEADESTGAPLVVSSPGAFGFWPWIDFGHGIVGVFLTQSTVENVMPLVDAIRTDIIAQIEACGCAADLNGNGFVGPLDLGMLLSSWGAAGGASDLDGDGLTDASDLAILLSSWGVCPS